MSGRQHMPGGKVPGAKNPTLAGQKRPKGSHGATNCGFDTWISFKGQGISIDGVANDNGLPRRLDGYMTDWLNRWALEFV